jgi:hypothetical protein
LRALCCHEAKQDLEAFAMHATTADHLAMQRGAAGELLDITTPAQSDGDSSVSASVSLTQQPVVVAAGERLRSPLLHPAVARHHPQRAAPQRNISAASLAIVFSASWVRLGAPLGEGAFSTVFQGTFTSPETGVENIVGEQRVVY